MGYSPGDIVLGDFPFIEDSTTKRRPFLILANHDNKFYWGIMITGSENIRIDDRFVYILSNNQFSGGFELSKSSALRLNIIQTVNASSIQKRFCKIDQELLLTLINMIKSSF